MAKRAYNTAREVEILDVWRMLNDEGAWRTEWMRWDGCSQLNSKQGENGRGSRVTVLGEPGIRVSWCWNTGC